MHMTSDVMADALNELAVLARANSEAHGFNEQEEMYDKQMSVDIPDDDPKAIQYFVRKGMLHGGVDVPMKLMLIVTEVSEAMEDYRNYDDLHEGSISIEKAKAGVKPEGFGSELADIVIRTLELAEALGIDIGHAVRTKMAYNVTRPHKHGGKRA